MELQVGDLVQHLAGIPDNGVGIVLDVYETDPSRHGCGSLPNPYREVKVLWQKPHAYTSWVGNHQLEKKNTNNP